ncbi:uncharacterized protein LOC131686196 [Topomyia yanbarensis]|uniref:uncharacterized protein LOC131686196 n=1 Tax=Topomyia yanbarensis TaxID=2498891 RepID=UPI00273C2CB6|nr:uncharacterized protein LOC131686196 [Topomyia yanbarensis]
MTRKCVVPGCGSSHKSTKMRFFRFPTIKSSSPLLSMRRFNRWITMLGFRSHYNPVGRFVCSLHFISGNPAKDTDVSDVDWAPTLNIPNNSTDTSDLEPVNVSNQTLIKCLHVAGSGSVDKRTESYETDCTSFVKNNFCGCDVTHSCDSFESFAARLHEEEPASANQLQSTFVEYSNSPSTVSSEMDKNLHDDIVSSSKTPSYDDTNPERTSSEIMNIENHEAKCCLSGNNCSMTRKYRAELAELQHRVTFLEIQLKRGLDWIANDERARLYTGINSYATLKRIFEYVEGSLFKPSCHLTKDQLFIMTLRKLRRGTPFVDMANEYSASVTTISKYFHRTVLVMYSCLKYALEPPSQEVGIRHLPRFFGRHSETNEYSLLIVLKLHVKLLLIQRQRILITASTK